MKNLVLGGHLHAGHKDLPDHRVTFDAQVGSMLLRRLSTILTLSQISDKIDMSRDQAKHIVDTGYLQAMEQG